MPDALDPAGSGPDDGGASDLLGTESGRWRWREHWRASPVSSRALLVTAAGAALAAVVVADVAVHTQPARHVRTVFEPARPGPVTVDSSGCPARARCTATAQVPAKVSAAVLSAFPGAEVTSSVLVRDAASGRSYERLVTVRSGRTSLVVTAQCIPGARARPARIEHAPAAGVDGTGPRHVETVVAGRDGCSVSVAADVDGDATMPEAAVIALAYDSALQLTP